MAVAPIANIPIANRLIKMTMRIFGPNSMCTSQMFSFTGDIEAFAIGARDDCKSEFRITQKPSTQTEPLNSNPFTKLRRVITDDVGRKVALFMISIIS